MRATFRVGGGGLSFGRKASKVQSMSTKGQSVLDEFNRLPRAEQWEIYQSIARNLVPDSYGPLSDDDLTTIASQTFALLDEEEARAKSR
jgi:hypothetical protein